MEFVLGLLCGMFFLTALFMFGGSVFKQLAEANIEIEHLKKQLDECSGYYKIKMKQKQRNDWNIK